MPAPTYMTPQYISIDMVTSNLSPMVRITDVEDDKSGSIYVGVVNNLITMAEAEVINDVLSNYLALPLQGINGESFADLYDMPEVREYSYTPIRAMFVNCSLFFIYRQYLADGGNTNAQSLFEAAENRYNRDKTIYQELDIAKNPRLKNAFRGMKRVDNYSQRIPSGCTTPDIYDGENQSWAAENSVLNLRA